MREGGGNQPARFFRAPLLLAGAFVLLVVFALLLLGQAESSIFGRVPALDEVHYLDRAGEIAAGQPSGPHFMSPLYPRLVHGLGGGTRLPESGVLMPGDLRGLRGFQLACWLGTLILARLLAGLFVPKGWSGWRRGVALWLPSLMLIFYLPGWVYGLAVLLELPLVLLTTLAFSLAVAVRRGRLGGAWIVLAGLALGAAGLLRGTVLLLAPLLFVLAWRGGTGRPGRGVRACLLGVGLLSVLVPAVVHNSRLSGRLVGPTLNGGVNLFIGNGPEANGFYVGVVPGDWRRDPAGREYLAQKAGAAEVTLAAADAIWRDEALAAMRADPLRTGGLLLRKVWLQLQGWEIDQLTPLAGWKREVPLLRGMGMPYALLVVLAAAGLAAPGRHPGAWWLAAAVVILVLGQSIFFVVSRYRLVLVPLLAVAGGLGAVRLLARERSALVVAGIAVLLTVPWGLGPVRDQWTALAATNEAVRWAAWGAAEADTVAWRRAEQLYRQALDQVPDQPAAWQGLALALEGLEEPGARRQTLRAGIDSVGDKLELQRQLLAAELAAGRPESALELVREILAAHPHDQSTLHNGAVLLARTGDGAGALRLARILCEAHPDDPQGPLDVGVLLARSGRREEARAALQAGLDRFPGHPELQRNLDLLLR